MSSQEAHLKELQSFYSQYFLDVSYRPSGQYTVHDESAYFDRPWVNISRPGEDWCLIIEWRGSQFLVQFAECWAGTTLAHFSFRELDALLDLFSIFQLQAERLTSPFVNNS